MTIEQIRKAVRAQPFRPFSLHLADGRRFTVRHPEFLFVSPEASRTIIMAGRGEDYSVIDLLLVTSLDFKNGKAKQPRRR